MRMPDPRNVTGTDSEPHQPDFRREMKARTLVNSLIIFLKTQPQFEVWWFTTLGSDRRDFIFKKLTRILLKELI